ncbi:MAG TPA: glycerol-3-phosphate 1-O-acyltransferase PlsY [Chroococcales cyanobacterium]
MASAFLMIAVAFVVGGIPTGYWLTLALKGIDIRKHGSGSTGATNVWRVVSKQAGIAVFAIDVLKGLIPVLLARYLNAHSEAQNWQFIYPNLVPALSAVAALVGHSKSVFLGFQGGKSAATGLGTLVALCPLGGAMTFVTWLVVLFTIGYVSLASILGVLSCGFWFALFGAPQAYVGYCVIGFLYVTYRHKANIKRMLAGTEPKFGGKLKPPGSGNSSTGDAENDIERRAEARKDSEKLAGNDNND